MEQTQTYTSTDSNTSTLARYALQGTALYAIASTVNLGVMSVSNPTVRSLISAPIVEEILKSTMGLPASIVFSCIENVQYIVSHGASVGYITMMALRFLITTPLHIATYKLGKRYGLPVAILAHGLYNLLATSGADVGIIALLVAVYYIIIKRSK